jgi:predicted dehydrogenase
MGGHHVRCARQARGIELVGAADIDPARAQSLPAGVPFTTDVDALLADSEAIVLAVPADRHEELGLKALAAGCHLLIEKPLAPSVSACRRLSDAASTYARVVGVGHVERQNGALLGVRGRIRSPRFVEGHRLAGYDPRGSEVDVILDLMIHDIDLVLAMFGVSPQRVDAVGVAVVGERIDIANARLEFPNGGLANLTASRVSREPLRKFRVFQSEAYFSLDLQQQTGEIFRRDAEQQPFGVRLERVERAEGHNPLVRELEEFAAAVRGDTSDLVTTEEGTQAVACAELVREAIERRREQWTAEVPELRSSCGDRP